MFKELVDPFIDDYTREYGERRVRKIISKIENSKSVKNYLIKLQEIGLVPHPKDVIVTVMNSPYFPLANKYTVGFASVYLLTKWNNEINADGNIASDYDLEMIFREIMVELRQF